MLPILNSRLIIGGSECTLLSNSSLIIIAFFNSHQFVACELRLTYGLSHLYFSGQLFCFAVNNTFYIFGVCCRPCRSIKKR